MSEYLVFVNEHDYVIESELFVGLIGDVRRLLPSVKRIIWSVYRAGCSMNQIVFEYEDEKTFIIFMGAIDRLNIPKISHSDIAHGHIEMEVYDGTDVAYFIRKICDIYGFCGVQKDSYHSGLVFCLK
ncbi:hypothetical protein ALQ33_200069 [Pseudomonas syringae pv. philadelphi]|uniref:Uncharacterized protein n=1 Tax=Pseudomonas syringae pv. philadelphi TaxID=251706 RepID=A0A3M3Z7B5_9PSED|nr:hypothetical protein [Pseudomonas syringae group genomosp. 3]RMO89733.1 hypothetical protein ALQ33_200069 [Pseudomonas syringae pv. philadelphi]